jgi:hypothetical protein
MFSIYKPTASSTSSSSGQWTKEQWSSYINSTFYGGNGSAKKIEPFITRVMSYQALGMSPSQAIDKIKQDIKDQE